MTEKVAPAGFWVTIINPPHVCPVPKLKTEDQQTYYTGSVWECGLDGRRWRIDSWNDEGPVWGEVIK